MLPLGRKGNIWLKRHQVFGTCKMAIQIICYDKKHHTLVFKHYQMLAQLERNAAEYLELEN